MKLAATVANEANVSTSEVMLLRHTNDTVAKLRKLKLSIEEYSSAQPSNGKYDYLRDGDEPKISIVVLIADDQVHGVYRVAGIVAQGASDQILTSAEQLIHQKPKYPCKRFNLNRIASTCVGLAVIGWKNRERSTVQRSKDSFFNEIEVGNHKDYLLLDEIARSFQMQLDSSSRDTSETRLNRLAKAEVLPARILVKSYYFVRNPDVVIEALSRANGVCQRCMKSAPFKRRSDDSPYLEVHHELPLAQGGQDTIENAIALCPNCHRKAHHA